jgi:hypothetical protein
VGLVVVVPQTTAEFDGEIVTELTVTAPPGVHNLQKWSNPRTFFITPTPSWCWCGEKGVCVGRHDCGLWRGVWYTVAHNVNLKGSGPPPVGVCCVWYWLWECTHTHPKMRSVPKFEMPTVMIPEWGCAAGGHTRWVETGGLSHHETRTKKAGGSVCSEASHYGGCLGTLPWS